MDRDAEAPHAEDAWQERTRLLLGQEECQRLSQLRVLLFGVGGVGSWCAEALIRSGIEHLTIVDFDRVSPSNINRQLPALHSTVGALKVDVMKKHLLDINPQADITALASMYEPEQAETFHMETYDYVIDAIDSLHNKADLIWRAGQLPTTQLISAMGAARKQDPLQVRIASFNKVKGCPLARALRGLLKHQGHLPLPAFPCVYSEETPAPANPLNPGTNGSLITVTATFGLALASIVINP